MTKSNVNLRDWLASIGRGIRAALRLVRRSIPRVYSLGVLLVICWLTFLSIRYLIRSMVTEAASPQQIVGLPTRLDPAILATERADWKAIGATDTPRIPPAHYHRLDSWIEPDNFNNCSRAGCHGPLPHTRHKEVRAFLNMHATSIHCGVCHMTQETQPLRLTWYDLETGAPQEPPAILRLFALITSPDSIAKLTNADKATQAEIVRLLRLAAHDAGDSNALSELAAHFAAVRPESGAFAKLCDETRAALPRHFRGEYGAKFAIRGEDGQPILGHPDSAAAVEAYLQSKDRIAGKEREELLARVHTRRREAALKCTACHSSKDSPIPFEALGYPAARLRALVDPAIFGMIENMNAERPLKMPDFLAPSGDD